MNYVIGGLDIETSGLEQEKGHRIIEIAIILYSLDTETNHTVRKGKFVQRINPERPIDPSAFAVHGISFEQVSMCPTWEATANKVYRIMSACDVVAAHNGDEFDLPFIAAEFIRIGHPIPSIQSVDTMLQARWATDMGKFPNLGELCFATGVSYDPSKAHAAEYDVECMLAAFFVAHKKGFMTLPTIKKERKAA